MKLCRPFGIAPRCVLISVPQVNDGCSEERWLFIHGVGNCAIIIVTVYATTNNAWENDDNDDLMMIIPC